jgi:hypothetical protein
VYPSVADAEADYQLVKDLHTEAGLIDAYDAAVVERRDDGKVRIARKHETPTRLGGGIGLATGLVVVGVSDMGAKIEEAMRRADKLQTKELRADTAAIEADAREAGV